MNGDKSEKKLQKKKKKKKTSIVSVSSGGGRLRRNAVASSHARIDKRKKFLLDLVDSGDVDTMTVRLLADEELAESVETMETLLPRACEKGLLDMAALLLRYRAPVNVLGEKELAPLHTAVKRGHVSIVALLISRGASVDIRTRSERRSSLHLAAIMGQVHLTTLLLQNEAEIDAGDIYGGTPLHMACHLGRENMVSLLLDYGADVNSFDNEGWTGLHLAAEAGQIQIIKLLVENYAHVNQQNRYGRTALHWAVKVGQQAAVRSLLEAGSSTNIRDLHEKTPLDYCSVSAIKKLFDIHSMASQLEENSETTGMPSDRRGVVGKLMTIRRPLSENSLVDSSDSSLIIGLRGSASVSSLSTDASKSSFPRVRWKKVKKFVVEKKGGCDTVDDVTKSPRDSPQLSSPDAESRALRTEDLAPPGRISPNSGSDDSFLLKSAPNCMSSASSSASTASFRIESFTSLKGEDRGSENGEHCVANTSFDTPRGLDHNPSVYASFSDFSTFDAKQSSGFQDHETDPFSQLSINVTEQMKTAEANLESLLSAISDCESQLSPEVMSCVQKLGQDTKTSFRVVEHTFKSEVTRMTALLEARKVLTNQMPLPVIFYSHFLSAAGRHIGLTPEDWQKVRDKLIAVFDTPTHGDKRVSSNGIICGPYEVLFKLFNMASQLDCPPIKYTLGFLEKCDLADVSCADILVDFIRDAIIVKESAPHDTPMSTLALRLGSDGYWLRTALGLSESEMTSSAAGSQSVQSESWYDTNMSVLTDWESTFEGNEKQKIVTMTSAVINIGREDLLDAILQISESTVV